MIFVNKMVVYILSGIHNRLSIFVHYVPYVPIDFLSQFSSLLPRQPLIKIKMSVSLGSKVSTFNVS